MGGLTDEPWFPILAVAAAAFGIPAAATLLGGGGAALGGGTALGAGTAAGTAAVPAGLASATGIELMGAGALSAQSPAAMSALTAAQAGYMAGPEVFIGSGAGVPIGPVTTPLSAASTLFTPPADPSIWSQMAGNLSSNLGGDLGKAMTNNVIKSALSPPQGPIQAPSVPAPRRREPSQYQPITSALGEPPAFIQPTPTLQMFGGRYGTMG